MKNPLKFARIKLQHVLLLGLLISSHAARAQAGGSGAAGAGSATRASGPGAGASAAGRSTNTAGHATGQQGTANTPQNAASAYAASASAPPDPRKPPQSKPGALTLSQVLELALQKNPTLLAAEQNLRAVKAQEIQAGVRTNPYVTVYGTDVTEGVNAASPYNYSVQMSRLFERGDKRHWRVEAAKATTAQTKAQLADTIRQTELTIRQAFTHMLIAKEAAELAVASLEDFRHQVQIGNDRYKAGDLGKLDFERLDLQLGSLESDQVNSQIALQQSNAQLQTLIGVSKPTQDFDIVGEIVPPLVVETKDSLEQSALNSRPDFAAARFGAEVADANAHLAEANGTTDPTLEAEYDRTGAENSAGFSVNIPLRIFDRNQGNKQTAHWQASASQFTVAASRNQVVSDVDQAWVAYQQSKHLSDRFGEHYLDESQDVLQIAQFAFEHGGLALIDYLDALRGARTSASDALNAYQQTWLAIHQLSAASGINLTP